MSFREQVDTSTPHGTAMFAIPSAIGEVERDLIRERVLAGVRRAQAAGSTAAVRPDLDLRPALSLLREERDLKDTARILRLDRNTLRRRLREAAMWPLPHAEAA